MYVRNPLVWILLCTYVTTAYVKKATPQSVTSTTRASDQTVNEVTIMACFKSTQTHPKFQYRFLALNRHDKKAKPCRLSVEATTEHEARRILAPHFILSFAARLPVTIEKTSTVQEVHHA
ncbi:host cell division inhibitor Icd-like protein [Hafnia alvei]